MPPKGASKGYCVNGHIDPERTASGCCKPCQRMRSPGGFRKYLLNQYGLTVEQAERLLMLQNGVCAICKGKGTRSLAVDHDHETGQVRGFLCSNCNTALGSFRDDPALLKAAIEYLARNQCGVL